MILLILPHSILDNIYFLTDSVVGLLSSNTSKNANPNIQLLGTSLANYNASSAEISSSFGQKKLYAEPYTGKSTFHTLLNWTFFRIMNHSLSFNMCITGRLEN